MRTGRPRTRTPESIRAYQIVWYEGHKEQVRACSKARYARYGSEIREAE